VREVKSLRYIQLSFINKGGFGHSLCLYLYPDLYKCSDLVRACFESAENLSVLSVEWKHASWLRAEYYAVHEYVDGDLKARRWYHNTTSPPHSISRLRRLYQSE
jgi:hypothetical protein